MRNNKNIDRASIKVGLKVKIVETYPNGAFTVMVYPSNFIGRIMVLPIHEYRVVKQL